MFTRTLLSINNDRSFERSMVSMIIRERRRKSRRSGERTREKEEEDVYKAQGRGGLYGARGYGALIPCRHFNIYRYRVPARSAILNTHPGDFGPRPWVPAKVAA